ncbi:hypothetical protein NE237_022898 [Protea cynaroides]|uniref:Uncharacterized protein n=1 Tax=Protea cynaroides TaxID=273540 RepID=A0A9Q0K3Y8_9MAGN|nr:hypothetical protein NE237_022898 [Protea cynaroides]
MLLEDVSQGSPVVFHNGVSDGAVDGRRLQKGSSLVIEGLSSVNGGRFVDTEGSLDGVRVSDSSKGPNEFTVLGDRLQVIAQQWYRCRWILMTGELIRTHVRRCC